MYEYRKLSLEERKKLVEERRKRGFPLHQPPHLGVNDQTYLLSAACYEHKHHINTLERRYQILDTLFSEFTMAGMELFAWVVMTNHYHILVNVTDFKLLGPIFGRIHGGSSFTWNGEENTRGRKVWYKYSDRAIRSDRHFNTSLNYIHFNPVKHCATQSPYDWETSSVHWYLEYHGRDWLRDLWVRYPVRDYGKKWDID